MFKNLIRKNATNNVFFNQYSLEACLKIMCYASSKDSTYIDGDIRMAKSLMVNEKNPKTFNSITRTFTIIMPLFSKRWRGWRVTRCGPVLPHQ